MGTTVVLYIFILLFMVATTMIIPESTYNKDGIKYKLHYWLIALIPILTYTLFWGLRYEVGTDYNSYVRWFYDSDIHEPSGEYLYVLLNWILRNAGFSEVSEFIVTSFLCVFPIFLFSYKQNRIFASFVICFFFLTGSVFFAQNGIRQALSLCVLIPSVLFLERRKIIGALIVFIISFFLHKSTIIPILFLIILYFIPYLKVNKYLILVTYIAFELAGHALQQKVMDYTGVIAFLGFEDQIENALLRIEDSVAYNSGLGRILRMIMISSVILQQDKVLTKEKDVRYYFWWLFVVGIILARIFSGNIILERVSKAFSLLDFVTISYVCSCIIMGNKKRITLTSFVPILLVVGYFLTFIIAILNSSNGVSPYQLVSSF